MYKIHLIVALSDCGLNKLYQMYILLHVYVLQRLILCRKLRQEETDGVLDSLI